MWVGHPHSCLPPPPPPGARFPFFYVFPKQNSFTLTLLNRGLNLESGSKGHAVTVWSRVDLDNQVLDKWSSIILIVQPSPQPPTCEAAIDLETLQNIKHTNENERERGRFSFLLFLTGSTINHFGRSRAEVIHQKLALGFWEPQVQQTSSLVCLSRNREKRSLSVGLFYVSN